MHRVVVVVDETPGGRVAVASALNLARLCRSSLRLVYPLCGAPGSQRRLDGSQRQLEQALAVLGPALAAATSELIPAHGEIIAAAPGLEVARPLSSRVQRLGVASTSGGDSRVLR